MQREKERNCCRRQVAPIAAQNWLGLCRSWGCWQEWQVGSHGAICAPALRSTPEPCPYPCAGSGHQSFPVRSCCDIPEAGLTEQVNAVRSPLVETCLPPFVLDEACYVGSREGSVDVRSAACRREWLSSLCQRCEET